MPTLVLIVTSLIPAKTVPSTASDWPLPYDGAVSKWRIPHSSADSISWLEAFNSVFPKILAQPNPIREMETFEFAMSKVGITVGQLYWPAWLLAQAPSEYNLHDSNWEIQPLLQHRHS